MDVVPVQRLGDTHSEVRRLYLIWQPYVAAMYGAPVSPTPVNSTTTVADSTGTLVGGVSQGPDRYTQDGLIVRGRCHLLGCSRILWRYNNLVCSNCSQKGLIASEGELPRQPGGFQLELPVSNSRTAEVGIVGSTCIPVGTILVQGKVSMSALCERA